MDEEIEMEVGKQAQPAVRAEKKQPGKSVEPEWIGLTATRALLGVSLYHFNKLVESGRLRGVRYYCPAGDGPYAQVKYNRADIIKKLSEFSHTI